MQPVSGPSTCSSSQSPGHRNPHFLKSKCVFHTSEITIFDFAVVIFGVKANVLNSVKVSDTYNIAGAKR